MLLGRPVEMNWPTATAGLRGPSAREGRWPSRASAHGLARPGWLRQSASPARARGRDGAARPAAGGHLRPRQGEPVSARAVLGDGERGRVARRGWRGEGRRLPWRPSTAAPWPSVAKRGEARPVHGRRRKLERGLKEGEAKLRARGIEEWRGGAGDRRRRSCGRGEGGARGSRLWRRRKAAWAGVSERTGTGS